MKKVIVIGAGAAGMMSAIWAANRGASVTILEHTDRIGKKILATGNGRCNLTNLYMSKECYRSNNSGFPMHVIEKFNVTETLDFFQKLGIITKDRNGYVYPNSDQAVSVLDALKYKLSDLNVKILLDSQIETIYHKNNGGFQIKHSKGCLNGDCLILAAGSKASPSTGSDGSGYKIAETLGHSIIKPVPALVQLRCKEKYYKQISGVRTDVRITLFAAGKKMASDTGELQLTDYGISGIPVFQVSRFASAALEQKKEVYAIIDFLPNIDFHDLKELLLQRKKIQHDRTAEMFMNGILNKKLSALLLKLAGIHLNDGMSSVSEKKIMELCTCIKSYKTEINATNPFENAQICAGGVNTDEINPETMESNIKKGLYFAGEIMDVDGICGGYNLQWAWSSGKIAGCNAAIEK